MVASDSIANFEVSWLLVFIERSIDQIFGFAYLLTYPLQVNQLEGSAVFFDYIFQ